MDAKEYLKYIGSRCRYQDFVEYMTSDETVAYVNEFNRAHGVEYEYTKDTIREISLERPRLAYAQMVRVAASMGMSTSHVATIGSLPLNDLNACATTAPNGELIIIIDVLLDVMIHAISLTVVRTNQLLQRAELTEEQLYLYYDFLLSVCSKFTGVPIGRDFVDVFTEINHKSLPSLEINHARLLKEAIILFILAYEHAHHCLGHLSGESAVQIRGINGELPLSIFNRSQEQEFEADRLGMQIYLECRKSSSSFTLHSLKSFPLSPLIFFAWLEVLNIISGIDSNCMIGVSTPPPPTMRLAMIEEQLQENMPQLKDPQYRYGAWLFDNFVKWALNNKKVTQQNDGADA